MFGDLTWRPDGEGGEVAQLWGIEAGPQGMLIRAPAGYSTGFRTLMSDYRAFVISGSVTSDLPGVEQPEAMDAGAFWGQPGGTAHVTTCRSDCVFYVEATGSGASTAGLETRRIAAEDMPWVDAPNTGGTVKLAHIWGDPNDSEPSGFFLFFKAGFPGFPHTHTNNYDGVVLKGRPRHWEPGETNILAATAGSHLWQVGNAVHDDACEEGEDCIVYFRFHGMFDIQPAQFP